MAEGLTITDKELQGILAEVRTELGTLLKSEEQELRKAAEESASSGSPSASPMSPSPEASAGSAQTEPAPPAPDAAAPSPDAAAAPASPAPDQGAADSGAIEPAPSVDSLASEYAGLSPEAFEMHLEAIRMVMEQQGGAAAPAPSPEAAPSAPPASPALKAEQVPAGKEMKMGEKVPAGHEMSASGSPERKAEKSASASGSAYKAERSASESASHSGSEMSKHEAKVAALEAELAQLRKSEEERSAVFGQVIDGFKKRFGAPMQKAITDISQVAPAIVQKPDGLAVDPKVVDMSRDAVNAKLRDVARNPSLSKADRQKIDGWTLGHLDVKEIQHLLQ